jgi:hypothetical protein
MTEPALRVRHPTSVRSSPSQPKSSDLADDQNRFRQPVTIRMTDR